ncbi:MAG TPA: Gfo/Idh/MocA family oxidoreductase [Micromonosporaceae bacterium]|nr:Gfo/Idh/MocA family oxidoreductase [Micromonosporaceae bacterium]
MRFGLLGTGYWAVQTQGAVLAAHPEAELVAVWGRDPAKAARVADRYGARAYPVLDALWSDVDAVAMALPPDVQAELAVRAAEAGRHLLLDKPLALTVEAADRVVASVERHRLSSVIFFTNRFFPPVEELLAEAAQTGRAGGWDGARATWLASIFGPDSPYAGSTWRHEHGGLWDLGPHTLSIILPVLGPVDRVAAMDAPHGTTHAMLHHAGGAVSTFEVSIDAPKAAARQEFTFSGSAGLASLPPRGGDVLAAFGAAVSQLVRDARAGVTAHPCDVRFGREVVAVLAAADAARRTGCTTPVARA